MDVRGRSTSRDFAKDFLIPAFLIPMLPVPMLVAVQYLTAGDWRDGVVAALGWLVFPIGYWWPVGWWLIRGRGGWLARSVVAFVGSVPLFVLCLFVVYPAFGARFAPGAHGTWGTYLAVTPWFFVYVGVLCLLVGRGGRLARVVRVAAGVGAIVAVAAPLAALRLTDAFRPPAVVDRPTVIVNARIIDVDSGRVLEGYDVHLADGRIASIDRVGRLATPSNSNSAILDAHGGFLVPGLIDVHTHLQVPVASLGDRFSLRYAATEMFGRFAQHRREYVAHGVTSVRDLGGPARTARQLRDQLGAHALWGPRLFTVGRLITSLRGHPVGTIWTPQIAAAGAIEASDSTTLDAAIQADIADFQPDALKIVYGTIGRAQTRLRADLLQEAVTQAARHRLVSIVHAEHTDEMQAAVDAGATGIEHVASMEQVPDDLLELLAAKRPFVDATFGEYRLLLRQQRRSEEDIASALVRARVLVKRLFDAGVPIAVGTDAPLVRYGAGLHDELRELRLAGLPPAAVLRAATVTNAAYLGRPDSLGRIASGYQADLVLVAENPLEEPETLRAPLWTMVDGVVMWKTEGGLVP